jgi:hypothetical protein
MCPSKASKQEQKTSHAVRIGKLPPRYRFNLNPYRDARFTSCPICSQKMGQRKLPLFIHIDPMYQTLLNYTCKYCSLRNLLLVHQDRLEDLLIRILTTQKKEKLIGNEYLVLGTVDLAVWKEGRSTLQHALDNMHDFVDVLTVEPAHYGWVEDKLKSPGRAKRDKPGTKDIEK